MNTSRFSIYVILVLMVGGLWACLDHQTPAVAPGTTNPRLRVRTITLDLPDNRAKVSSFRYDAQGRLGSILTYQTPDSTVSETESSTYQYDGQNRLTGLRRSVVLYPRSNPFSPVEQYLYSYNDAGQVSGINYVNGFALSLRYNSANQPASGGRFFGISGLTVSGGNSFTFTGNNLTTFTDSRNIPLRSGPDPVTTAVITYTHDDKVNPFYGVYVIPAPYPNGFVNMGSSPRSVETYFGGVENVLNLSQNNVLSEAITRTTTGVLASSSTSSVTYQYQYNAANLPTVRIKTSTAPAPNNTVTVETLRFEYESY